MLTYFQNRHNYYTFAIFSLSHFIYWGNPAKGKSNIRNNVGSDKSCLLYEKYHQFYFIPHLHTMSEAATWAFQNSTSTTYSLILVPQCLGGLSQTNQGRNTTSLIHNVLIHFICLLRHPRPVIYLQR